jgi:56kDa selenium binding protein (SBP56)
VFHLRPLFRLHHFQAATAALLFTVGSLGLLLADDHSGDGKREKYMYVWASDQARVAPDFLAVIDFNEESRNYGRVLKTVPIPPPGNIGNEAHHCHLNADETILGCGGLLSLLKGQNSIFFFNVQNPNDPRFLFSTNASQSSITDDFLPLANGGFLVTQMGSASGGAPGRVAEFDPTMQFVGNHFGNLTLTRELPATPPLDGFNPHGISARPDLNLMMTSDFILPASTLNVVPGDPVLRNTIRVWDYSSRKITKTITIPGAVGLMDVKMIPHDRHGIGITAGMFDGLVYSLDPASGTATTAFDCETITPHIETPVRGGMTQIMALPDSGDRLLFGLFQAGQVGMLDISNRNQFKQLSVVSLGLNAGPHNLMLTDDDSRLVVVDYFLNEDGFGKVHAEGDHKVHVIKVDGRRLTLDPRFNLDFNTAFPTGPARPHGVAMK